MERGQVAETDVQELVELAARSTDGLAASRKWVVSPAVCRRYLAAAASAAKPGATAALPFLLRSARWRDEQAVDAMLEDRPLLNFERSLRETMLYEVWNDASGRPLMVERVGAWDLARLTRLVDESPEQVVRAHILVNERIRVRLDGGGGGADGDGGAFADGRASTADGGALADRRAVLVFDLQGLGVAHLACRSLLRLFGTLSSLDAAHFPDTVGTIVCIDAPRVFAALWATVSRLVAAGTRNKLLVYASTARAEACGALRELCGSTCLPSELGGSRDHALPYHIDYGDRPGGVDTGDARGETAAWRSGGFD